MSMADCPCCLPPWSYEFPGKSVWTLMKMSDSGETIWTRDMGTQMPGIGSALGIDKDDAYLFATASSTVYILNLDGSDSSSFSENATSTICNVKAGRGSSGNFLTQTQGASTIVKMRNSSGTVLWTKTGSPDFTVSIIDPNDNVYVGTAGDPTLRAYDSSGTLLWSYSVVGTGGLQRPVDSTSSLMLAVGATGGSATKRTTHVFDTAGALQWSAQHGAQVNDGRFMPNGNVVVGGNPDISVGGDGMTTRCYDSSGTLQWSADHSGSATGRAVFGIAVDSSNNVYACGDIAIDVDYATIRKYNSSGVLQWSRDYSLGANVTNAVTRRVYWADGYLYMWGTRVTR